MKVKSSTLGWGLGSAVSVNLPSILQTPMISCTGICGSCGGGCAIVGLIMGGVLVVNCVYKTCRKEE